MSYVDDIREQLTKYETRAKFKLPDSNYRDANRRVRMQRSSLISFFDGPAVKTAVDLGVTFEGSTILPIVDSLKTELDRRGKPIRRFMEASVS